MVQPMGCQKASARGTFVAINAMLKTKRKLQINNLTLHLKKLEKEEQTKQTASRRKEIIKGSEQRQNEIES